MLSAAETVHELFKVPVFHVTWQDTGSKRLITVSSKDDILQEIRNKFDVENCERNFEGLGEVWLDIHCLSDLPE